MKRSALAILTVAAMVGGTYVFEHRLAPEPVIDMSQRSAVSLPALSEDAQIETLKSMNLSPDRFAYLLDALKKKKLTLAVLPLRSPTLTPLISPSTVTVSGAGLTRTLNLTEFYQGVPVLLDQIGIVNITLRTHADAPVPLQAQDSFGTVALPSLKPQAPTVLVGVMVQ